MTNNWRGRELFTVALLLVIFFALRTSIASTLHLSNGETITCDSLSIAIDGHQENYRCDASVVQQDKIKGLTDSTGYHPYVANTFLSKLVSGKLSLYSGNVQSVEVESWSNVNSSVYIRPVLKKKIYYTFDDSIYRELRPFGANRPLEAELSSNGDAYALYRNYRASGIVGGVVLGLSVVPLIAGVSAIIHRHVPTGIVNVSFAAIGITASGVLRLVVSKRCFNRSLEIYNIDSYQLKETNENWK